MSIPSIGSYGVGYDNLATGNAILTAADNPAGMAIVEGFKSQVNGYDTGANNAETGQDLLNVSDGASSNITDSLQRIRELSVKASNSAIYGSDDLQAMQDEVSQLKQQIQQAAKGTEFNTLKLLDGSKADINLATNPSGKGMKINLADNTLETLGIADFDLTGDFNISTIDDAINKVTASRSKNGAEYNSLSHIVNYNNNSSLNLTASQSRIGDLDMEKHIGDIKKDEIMQQYKYFAQNAQNESALSSIQRLLA